LVLSGVLTLPELVARMSTIPAGLFRLPGGSLAPGAVADVCVLDPDARWVVRPADFHSKSRNTPFANRELLGRAVLTLVAGRVVYEPERVPSR
jgi:dihydroorotase